MKNLFTLLTCLLMGLSGSAQLTQGDIALVQYNADGAEIIKFLALTDIAAGETLNFTDNGWLASGAFRGGEGTAVWTAPVGGVACGDVVTFDLTGPALSGSGDQLIVYQGAAGSPTIITALNSEGAGIWQADATSAGTSALPAGLTEGTNAIALVEIDNAIYTGTLTGDKASLRAAIHDNTNWAGSNTVVQDFTGTFTVSDCGVACAISNLVAGSQTACASATNTYTQEVTVTYADNPTTGTLDINGQSFTITSSPQTETLIGLISDGAMVDVTAEFSDDTDCNLTATGLFTAPASCSTCAITAVADGGNQTACASDLYSNDVIVTYASTITTGTLDINGQSFAITGSPQTETLTGLSADGLALDVTATFSSDLSCTFTTASAWTAPASCGCSIDGITSIGVSSACNPSTDLYSWDVQVSYSNNPGAGTLDVNGQSFAITTSPQTVTLVDLVADGSDVDVTALFSDDAGCTSSTMALFTAPVSCFVSPIIINELDYDQAGSDTGEFIELYNTSAFAVDLDGYTIQLLSAAGASVYKTITLPAFSLAANDYYVICFGDNASAYCDQNETGSIQNGAPDAVAVLFSGSIVDALSYEGNSAVAEGTGAVADTGIGDKSLVRFPNGSDTNDNSVDFVLACFSPGAENIICPANDDCPDAIEITPSLFGTPSWDTLSVANASESLVGVAGDADDDTWFVFDAADSQDYIIAQVVGGGTADLVIEVFDACGGTSLGEFENYDAGQIERVIVGGLNPGSNYYYRVYDKATNAPATGEIRTQVKTFADGGIRDQYCGVTDYTLADYITPERQDLSELYPFTNTSVSGYAVRLIDPIAEDTLKRHQVGYLSQYFYLSQLAPEVNTTYNASARHRLLLSANGAINHYWSDWGPSCSIAMGDIPTAGIRPEYCDNTTGYSLQQEILADFVTGADSYLFFFTDGVNDFIEVNPTYKLRLYELEGLQLGVTYSAKVQTYKNGEWSDFGSICDIKIADTPEAIAVQSQYCEESYEAESVSYIQSDLSYGATSYEWSFAPLSGGAALTDMTASSRLYFHTTDMPLVADETYTVTVRAFVGGVWGTFGAPCTVYIIEPSTAINGSDGDDNLAAKSIEAVKAPELGVYPNPNDGASFIVSWDNDAELLGTCNVRILNLSGQLLMSDAYPVKGKDPKVMVRPEMTLSPGIYLVEVLMGNDSMTQRLVVE